MEKGEWRIFVNEWCGSRSVFNEWRMENGECFINDWCGSRNAFNEWKKGAPSHSPFSILLSTYKNIIPHVCQLISMKRKIATHSYAKME